MVCVLRKSSTHPFTETTRQPSRRSGLGLEPCPCALVVPASSPRWSADTSSQIGGETDAGPKGSLLLYTILTHYFLHPTEDPRARSYTIAGPGQGPEHQRSSGAPAFEGRHGKETWPSIHSHLPQVIPKDNGAGSCPVMLPQGCGDQRDGAPFGAYSREITVKRRTAFRPA